MSIFSSAAKVSAAATRARKARQAVGVPASALMRRGRENPLTMVGSAAGAGLVLGSLNVHPLRVPGVSALLSGGLAEAVTLGAKLVAELGAVGLTAAARDAVVDDGDGRQ